MPIREAMRVRKPGGKPAVRYMPRNRGDGLPFVVIWRGRIRGRASTLPMAIGAALAMLWEDEEKQRLRTLARDLVASGWGTESPFIRAIRRINEALGTKPLTLPYVPSSSHGPGRRQKR